MDKIRYGIIGFGTQGSSYCNILTGTASFPGMPAAAIPPHCALGAICDIDPAKYVNYALETREVDLKASINRNSKISI